MRGAPQLTRCVHHVSACGTGLWLLLPGHLSLYACMPCLGAGKLRLGFREAIFQLQQDCAVLPSTQGARSCQAWECQMHDFATPTTTRVV